MTGRHIDTVRYAVGLAELSGRRHRVDGGKFDSYDLETSGAGAELDVAGSASSLAYGIATSEGDQYHSASGFAVFAGPAAGPLTRVTACSNAIGIGMPPGHYRDYGFSDTVAINGATLAQLECDGSVVVRDLTAGFPVRRRLVPGGEVRRVELAGRYLAAAVAPDMGSPFVAVYDWMTAQRLYTVTTQDAIDLQDDGTLVVAHSVRGCSSGSLAWHSIAAPAAHALPVVPCVGRVAVANDEIAAVTQTGARRSLELVALTGARRRVADLGPPGEQVGAIDLDASAAAYALRTCAGGASLFRIGRAAAPQRAGTHCPLRIKRVARGAHRVHVVLRCPRGCAGRALLTRGRVKLARARFAHPSGGRVRVSLRETRRGARALAGAGSIRARLTIRFHDRAGRSRRASRQVSL